ncbi:MAG: trypsin-like peptidase domain-containing protein [Lachnospiraceae bacterium]|nr:trypsin-like peptidase domain-containing protein [Lachnospiraceae bacterium]
MKKDNLKNEFNVEQHLSVRSKKTFEKSNPENCGHVMNGSVKVDYEKSEFEKNGSAMVASEKKVCDFISVYRAISICTLVAVAALAVLMFAFSKNTGKENSEYPEYIVKITNGNLRGMGEIISSDSEKKVILTAGHCVTGNQSESVSVEFWDGYVKEVSLNEIYVFTDSDVAFIILNEKRTYEAYSPADEADKTNEAEDGLYVNSICFAYKVYDLEPLTDLMTDSLAENSYDDIVEDTSESNENDFEYSNENNPEYPNEYDREYPNENVVYGSVVYGSVAYDTVVYGTVLDPWIYMEDFDSHMIYLKMMVSPGMSGGGLYGSDGKLVGMLVGGTDDGEAAAVPWAVIEGAYTSLTGKTLPNFYN